MPPIEVEIRSNGTLPIAGQNTTLICNAMSAITDYSHTLTFRWLKNNRTQTRVGRSSSSISFPLLTLSDSGQYTCVVTVKSTSLKEDKEARSLPFSLDVLSKI